MSKINLKNKEYKDFILDLKKRIISSRNKAIIKVNSELIKLYFEIGEKIVLKQKESNWGDNIIGEIEKDLKREFPNLKGFSRTNLFYMKKFYLFFESSQKLPQLVGQMPWGHTRLILDKIKNKEEAIFYIQETISNNWSRVILEHQIELNLYQRKGKLLNNFDKTINEDELNLVNNSFKENYILDFLCLEEDYNERELENSLINDISNFLIELGKGFAFIGIQKKILVGGEEFFIDLLFYNYILKRFIVIEIKTTKFKPEHLGQINFYINTVNKDFKTKQDKETIGLLICKSKNQMVVEYALQNNKQPLGIAQYHLNELPLDIKGLMPSKDELEEVLK